MTAVKQITPPPRPMAIAESGLTNPEPGVMATRPATAPDAAPSTVGLPDTIHSARTQPSVALAAAMCVTTNAFVASPLAPNADPALNPNQPTHSNAAPKPANGRL